MGRIGGDKTIARSGWLVAALVSGVLVAALFWLMPGPPTIRPQAKPSVPLLRYLGSGLTNSDEGYETLAAVWSPSFISLPFRVQARRVLTNAPGGEISPPVDPPAESAMLLPMPANLAVNLSGISANMKNPVKVQFDLPNISPENRSDKHGDVGSVRRGLQVEWGGGLAGRPLDIAALCLADWPAVSKSVVLSARMSLDSEGHVAHVMLEMPSDDPELNAKAVRLLYQCVLPPEAATECEGTITIQLPLVPSTPAK